MKERVITAIFLLAVILPLIYFGGNWFLALMVVAASIAAWEMIAMHDLNKKIPLWIKGLTLLGTLWVVLVPADSNLTFYDAPFISIIFATTLLVINRIRVSKDQMHIGLYPLIIFYIGFTFRALFYIRIHHLMLFIFLIVTVILTDSAAYFAGRFFGRHKLAPKISPKKTVEGAIGGWLIGSAFALIFGLWQHLFTTNWLLITLAICLPALAQMGDLIASAFKRKYGIKDYGKLFPGHGGVMDRVDSQLLAALLIYLITSFGGVQ